MPNEISMIKDLEKIIKKTICIVLAVMLLCGCSAEKPLETTQAPTVPVYAEAENPVNFFSVSMGENYENILRMDAFYKDDGSVYVEYVGEEKKDDMVLCLMATEQVFESTSAGIVKTGWTEISTLERP